MIRFFIRVCIYLASAALGLLAAKGVLEDFHLEWSGFLVGVAVFAIAQSLLTPFIFNLARQRAQAVLGGVGIVSTICALLVTSFVTGGLRIDGLVTWVLGALIVWFITALGGWILPMIFLKKKVSQRSSR